MFHLILSRKFLLLVFLPTLLVSFQNCSPTGFKSIEDQATVPSQSNAVASTPTKITEPAINSLSQGVLVLRGNCSSQVNVQISGDILTTMSVPCTGDRFTASVTLSSGDGAKNIDVKQINSSGGESLDRRSFVKDTMVSSLLITSPASGATVTSPFVLSGTCETGTNVTIAGSGVLASTSVPCLGAIYSTSLNLVAGSRTREISVTQVDLAGNSANVLRSFQVPAAPSSPITIRIDSPAALTNVRTGITLTGSCQNGLVVDITGAGLSAATTATCAGGAFSKALSFSNGEGNKVITVSQTDSTSGQTGSDTRTFIKDSVAPAVTIGAPAANTTVKTSITISGACETGLGVTFAGSGVASSTSLACAGGVYSSAITLSNGDGVKQITVSQADAAGNSASLSISVIKDTQAPAVTIASPAVNTSAETGVTISGACETGLTVTASGTDLKSPVNANCNAGTYSAAVLFAGTDGAKVVTISQTDAIGNTGSVQRTFIQTTPPVNPPTPASSGFPMTFTPGALDVCPSGCTYKLPSQAMAQAQNGSIIEIEKGDYNDCLSITKNQITVRGIKGYAHMHTKICNQKGGIVTMGRDAVLENLELSGFDSSDYTTTSIRHDAVAVNLTMRNLYFHDSQKAVLGSSTGDIVRVENSLFERVGFLRPDGEISVPLYIGGTTAQLVIRNTRFLHAQGQATEIKSKALQTVIDCSVVANLDGPDSYSINPQTAGELIIYNSVIEKSSNSSNTAMIAYGDVGAGTSTNRVRLEGNVFLNDKGGGSVLRVTNGNPEIIMTNNVLVGGGSFISGSSSVLPGNSVVASRSGLYPAYPFLPEPGVCRTP